MLFLGTRTTFAHDTDPAGNVVTTGLIDLKSRVEVAFPPGLPLAEQFTTVTAPGQGVWAVQSPDEGPTWVASDDDDGGALCVLLAAHYGCEIRTPRREGERGEHAGRFPPVAGEVGR